MTKLYIIETKYKGTISEWYPAVVEYEARETPKQYKYKSNFGDYEFTVAKDDPRACLTREAAIQLCVRNWTRRVEDAQRELKLAQDGLEKARQLMGQEPNEPTA